MAKDWLLFGAMLMGLFLARELKKETNPLTGFWSVSSVVENGRRVPVNDFYRTFLKISIYGDASVADYWTCGAPMETFAEGKMVQKGNRIFLYEEDWATKARATRPNGELVRLGNGKIGFTLSSASGTYQLEFTRESNADTLFDWFGWR